mgnify:FL=1
MNGFDNDFLDFLKAYYPTDYILANSEDVKPESLSRIYNDYSHQFSIWVKVPASIRDTFNGRVPQEILQLAADGKEQILKDIAAGRKPPRPEDENMLPPPPPPEQIVASAAFAAALTAGYSKQASYELSAHHLFRESLKDKAAAGTMNETERKAWLQSRYDDIDTIKKDWSHCQHEKMLIHLFSKYNSGKIDKDKFLPQVVDLMQKIESSNHRDHLLAYLKTRPIQAKLAHFKEDVLDTLSQTILHDIPLNERDDYLRASIPLKIQMRRLIDKDNSGDNENLAVIVNSIVEQAEKGNIGLDLSNYNADSYHPMSAELRQMFMIACCIHDVPYRSPNGERINPNSELVKQLPADIQALVISRDMRLAKEAMIDMTGDGKCLHDIANTLPSVLRSQKVRESA